MKTILIFSFLFFSCLSAEIPEGYYDGTEGLTGEDLKTALHEIIDNHIEFPYTSTSTDTWDILKETDQAPDSPDSVVCLYTGWYYNAEEEYNNGQGWSREHVWAKSHGDFGTFPGAGTDVHHLRPCDISVNSSKSNKDFDNGGIEYIDPDGGASGCYRTTYTWEPREAVKGDVARMMFYMATRYEGDNGELDLELVDYAPSSPDGEPVHGIYSTLMEWHIEDPVDEWEENRNDIIYDYQENRNPFIDHPEFVELIYIIDEEIVVNEILPAPGVVTISELDIVNFSFDGYDPDGNPLEYSWQLNGVEVSTTDSYIFVTDYSSYGLYDVTLSVTDNFGTRRTPLRSRNNLYFEWIVDVIDVDQPIEVVELLPSEGYIEIDEGDVINFSIDAYDPDGNVLEYLWSVWAMPVSDLSSFDFITDETSAGDYEIMLYVFDNFGFRDEINFLWNVHVNNVVDSEVILFPIQTTLYQNYPNPFNPSTTISFDIPEGETGRLSIYSIKGQLIESNKFSAGHYEYLWKPLKESSGIYLYKIDAKNVTLMKKMVLLK